MTISKCITENCPNVRKGKRSRYCEKCFKERCSLAGRKGGEKKSRYLILETRVIILEKQLQRLQGLLNRSGTSNN